MGSARLVTMTAVVVAMAAGPAAAQAADVSPKAAEQIAALQRLKASMSPAERKLDSQLAVAVRQRRGDRTAAAAPGGALAKDGTAEVDVRARSVDADLLERLEAAGAHVRHVSRRHASIRARIPLSALERIAAFGAVRRVDAAAGAVTGRQPIGAPRPAESKEDRAARLAARLRTALAEPRAAVTSEGDRAHAADTARTRHRVTGVGAKICVISDGVDSLAVSQAEGELPDVDVLPGRAGEGDEGTAMLEIVHDLAPRAQLGFSTALPSDVALADNIVELRFEAGCDVIVDDVVFLNEAPFQDGPAAQAVNAVTADGALYFSSAGNRGNVIDGTAGNFEGDFVDSGQPAGKFRGAAHDFDPGPGVQIFEPLSDASSADVPVTLWWAGPLGGAANDYDLYLFDPDDNVLAFSQATQNGDDDPFEILFTPPRGGEGLRLAVVKFAGADRYFQLSAWGGRFRDSADGLIARVTPGQTRGHNSAVNAFSTAAAPAGEAFPFDLEPGDPPNPAGSFPNPFTRAQLPERFTSDGPRRVFFHADGTPITPGNFSSTGGTVRQKPDITAADGVSTTVEDFSPFFGTSAAAPHAAAIAALVASGNPGAATSDLRDAFGATALDLTPGGVDGRTGAGVIRADRVLAHTGATPQPLVRAGDPTVTPVTGDGDAFFEPGERATVEIPATNAGDGAATGVSVTASDADPQTTITPRSRSYGTIAAGATKSRSFTVELARGYLLGKPVSLAVRVTFAGVLSPTRSTFSLPVGQPATTPVTFSYDGPPVAIPDGSQVGAAVEIPVRGIGFASKLTFSIDGETCTDDEGATTVGIDHTFVNDLTATLTAPDGRTAVLVQNLGSGGNNLCQVVFDDAAERPFVDAEQPPFSGTWRPAEPLAALLSAAVDGTWTFKVLDTVEADTGSIRAVSVHVTGFVSD